MSAAGSPEADLLGLDDPHAVAPAALPASLGAAPAANDESLDGAVYLYHEPQLSNLCGARRPSAVRVAAASTPRARTVRACSRRLRLPPNPQACTR